MRKSAWFSPAAPSKGVVGSSRRRLEQADVHLTKGQGVADHATKQIEMPGADQAGARSSRALFAALLGAVLADAWLASTPMPLGGPNVWFAALLLLLTAHHVLKQTSFTATGWRSFASEHRAVVAVSVPAVLLLAWAGATFARSGAFDIVQVGRMAFGIGVLWATVVCVDSAGRAKAMLLAIMLCAAASALFGFGTLFVGEPFLAAWERLATVDDDAWEMVLLGRMAGLASHSSTLALQLVVALTVVPAALVWRAAATGATQSLPKTVALASVAAVLVLATLLNGHRATTIGVTAGCAAIVVFGWLTLRAGERRCLLWLLPMLGMWAGVFAQLVPTAFCEDEAEQRRRLDRAGDLGPLYRNRLPFRVRERGPGDESSPHAQGHRFEDIGNRLLVFEVRPVYAERKGEASAIVLEPTMGHVEISWYEPDDAERISAFEFRHRPVAEVDWTAWRQFVPAMSSRGQLFFDPRVDYGPAASSRTTSDLGDDPRFRAVRHVLAGFRPRHKYLVELQMRSAEHRTVFPMVVRTSASGEVPLVWFEKSRPPAPHGHRVRARLPRGREWAPWQTLTLGDVGRRDGHAQAVDRQRTVLDIGDLRRAPLEEMQPTRTPLDYLCHYVRRERFAFLNASSQSRLHQAVDALQHLATHLLGTGAHFPARSAQRSPVARGQRLDLVVDTAPHNQVLHVAVLFGVPGLALFGAFYVVVCWAAARTARLAAGSRRADFHFLAAALVGAVVAYSVVSLSMPIGPFTSGWGHFYLLGLLFSVLRLLEAHLAEREALGA